jgi:hypothetical protein
MAGAHALMARLNIHPVLALHNCTVAAVHILCGPVTLPQHVQPLLQPLVLRCVAAVLGYSKRRCCAACRRQLAIYIFVHADMYELAASRQL